MIVPNRSSPPSYTTTQKQELHKSQRISLLSSDIFLLFLPLVLIVFSNFKSKIFGILKVDTPVNIILNGSRTQFNFYFNFQHLILLQIGRTVPAYQCFLIKCIWHAGQVSFTGGRNNGGIVYTLELNYCTGHIMDGFQILFNLFFTFTLLHLRTLNFLWYRTPVEHR